MLAIDFVLLPAQFVMLLNLYCLIAMFSIHLHLMCIYLHWYCECFASLLMSKF